MRIIQPPFIGTPEAEEEGFDWFIPDIRFECPDLFIPGKKPNCDVEIGDYSLFTPNSFYWLMNERGGMTLHDLAGDANCILDATNPPEWVPEGLSFNGSDNKGTATLPEVIGPGGFTFFLLVRFDSADATYRPLGSIGTFSPAFYGTMTGTGAWGIYHSGSKPADSVLSANNWYVLIFTRRNGVLYFRRSTANGHGYVADGDESYTHNIEETELTLAGNRPSPANWLPGDMKFMGLSYKGWSDAQCRAFIKDPYQFLIPR